jgi:RimJ/RimL family protein N-acetyltransferase
MMMPSNLLRGDRVRLTALTRDDLPTLASWQEDAGFLRLFDALPAYPKTEATLAEWLEERHKATDHFLFAVRPLDSDELLGYVELDGVLWSQQVCGIAFCFGDPANRGKGFGFAAAQMALQFAFDELNLHRVTLTAFDYNQQSIALAEKLGFQREGVFREFLQRDGKRHDMLLFGLLRREWEAHIGRKPQ